MAGPVFLPKRPGRSIALVFEAGGTIGALAQDFLHALANGSSSRSSVTGALSFTTFAPQGLRLAAFRGTTAALIWGSVLHDSPEVEPHRGALPFGPLGPRLSKTSKALTCRPD